MAPALLAAGLGLSACTITPLYSTAPMGSPLQQELAAISILPVTDRTSQIVRNELSFLFTGGGEAAEPKYELSVRGTTGGGGLNITAPGNVASSIVTVTVRYTLINLDTGEVIKNGTASAETRYQVSNQAFANLRAREDAEEKAAIAAAETVRVQISAALASYVPAPVETEATAL
jgi:LPS-assembly lipoprotein